MFERLGSVIGIFERVRKAMELILSLFVIKRLICKRKKETSDLKRKKIDKSNNKEIK
jgi:hypothetical protein